MPPPLVPRDFESDAWDVTAISSEELALVRTFLARRSALPAEARTRLAQQLADRIRQRVATPGLWPTPEQLLEGVVRRKSESD